VALVQAKACKACRTVKALAEFYTDKRIADGRKNVCKACTRSGNRAPQAKDQDCSFEGCRVKQIAKGYCAGHYQQVKYGIPLRPLRFRNDLLSFLDKRLCTKCGTYKGQPQFRLRTRDGALNSWCTGCENAKNRRWHVDNEEKSRAQSAAWRIANPERTREIVEAYRLRDRDRYLALARKNARIRRARLLKAEGRGITLEVEQRIFDSTSGLCNYCDDEATAIDHFFPISKGGPDDEDNLVPACKTCNSSKHDSHPVAWLTKYDKFCRVIPKQFYKETSQ
jgi:5-methylcytosine-specific restriction endonuclease McrA